MIQVQQEALMELGKFFQLAADGVEGLNMPSQFIDRAWHSLIENKEAYEQFCIETCGKLIEHDPTAGEGLIGWVPAYEARFGKLPKSWFQNDQGMVDERAYRDYLNTGKWYAGWDCGPVVPTMN